MEVTVASDVDSVIGWWTDDARRLEWRAHLETSETVLDFDYRERIDHGVRITEVKYIAAPMNVRVHYRSARQMLQGDVAEVNSEGNRVLRTEVYQHRVLPGGKEDVSTGEWIREFISDGPQTTRVRVSMVGHKEGATWWEKYLPPIAERQRQRKELREQAARCERDLSVNEGAISGVSKMPASPEPGPAYRGRAERRIEASVVNEDAPRVADVAYASGDMRTRRWIRWVALTILVLGISDLAVQGVLKLTRSNDVQLLTIGDLPGKWRPIHNPEKATSVSCSGGFYRTNAPATISQQVAFEGPLGARLIEVVVPTDSPRSRYADATRPFNTCSATSTARIGADSVTIQRSTHTTSLSIYAVTEAPLPGTTEQGIQFFAFARLSHSVLCVLVATPTRLQVLGALVAKAIVRADPSLLPKRTFSFR
jgi:hypothetical protein